MQLQVEQLKRDIWVLHEQELEVDRFVNQMSELIRKGLEEQHTAGKDGQAYVTREDLQGLAAFHGETIMAIKAPSGTSLEVPDPDEGMDSGQRRYQIFLKSLSGPVEVYLVSKLPQDQEKEQATAAAAAAVAAQAEVEAAAATAGTVPLTAAQAQATPTTRPTATPASGITPITALLQQNCGSGMLKLSPLKVRLTAP